jgi:hypothetical protein
VIIRAIYGFYSKERKVKNRVGDPTKNNPYLSQKTEKNGGHCTGPLTKKKSIVYYLFIPSVFFEKPTEFHGVMRRIVNLLLNSHGREFYSLYKPDWPIIFS